MSKSTLVIMMLLLAVQSLTSAAVLNVPDQYVTIQLAINDANEGDTIIVGPGTYRENINFRGKNIVLTSTNPDDSEIVAATIIQGYGPSSVVTFDSGETSDAVITGFTVSGGYGTFIEVPEVNRNTITGGGIYCINASPTITKNVITNNSNQNATRDTGAEGWGGGIGCLNSNAIITHNILKNNSAALGGGILVAMGNAEINNNLIFNNSAIAGGGALIVAGSLINNTIVNNYSSDSGANVYLVSYEEFGYCTVLSNVISNARGTGSIFRESSLTQDRIEFNNIWDGSGNIYAPVTQKTDARGNIYQDPMLVNLQANDFRLQMDSPCINAGDPNYVTRAGEKDMYGNDRIIHGRIDIGAAEFLGNLRPVADAGDNQSIEELPEFVTLDGSSSHDPDGNKNISYNWTQTAGPSVDIEGADKQIAKFAPADYGIYSFELSVSDGTIDSFNDGVTIIVGINHIPVAVTGLPVYASDDVVTLDGAKSYDPDSSGELLYYWEQVSGPALVIADSDTATPQISGWVQTDTLQICEFQLIVYDGQYESVPGIAEVRIFPDFGRNSTVQLENSTAFDPNKPTMIYFGGGDCINGSGAWVDNEWNKYANILSMSYQPDNTDTGRTYYIYGDIFVKYLSEVAPDYKQMIQTLGHSTGGQPAIDTAIRMNLTYKDPRYNVNRVTLLDGRCRDYSSSILDFIDSAVDGETCWMDTYEGTGPYFYPGILNVQVALNNHGYPPSWYKTSLVSPNMSDFNGGLVGGAYWSVVGPGKNLQLAKTPFEEIYRYHWEGTQSGEMQFFDEANFPAKLPEPVTLLGPVNVGESDGSVLTCMESENAIKYQLLVGTDQYRVADYIVLSETPTPPSEVITSLPFENCWWTVKVYDAYGSSIYADPKPVNMFNLSLPVMNMTTGTRYGYVQEAIDKAMVGDELVLEEGTYNENIKIQNKNVILRSTNPDDPDVVEATVIKGIGEGSVVTCIGRVNSDCLISGLTITGSVTGLYCYTTMPTVTNCVIRQNKGSGVKLWDQSNPTFINCLITDNKAGIELYQIPARVPNSATIINCTISNNRQQGIWGGRPTIDNSIIYFNETQIEEGNLTTVTYSDVQDSWPGLGNIDVDPLFADPDNGDYHLKSQAGRWDPASRTWVRDNVTSPCIDAGNPGSGVGMEPEPNGSVINMGAYGGTIQASKSP